MMRIRSRSLAKLQQEFFLKWRYRNRTVDKCLASRYYLPHYRPFSTSSSSSSSSSSTSPSSTTSLPIDHLIPLLRSSLSVPFPVPGQFSLVSLPIGCISDISLRSLVTLRYSHIIVCEDTRITKTLLYSLFSSPDASFSSSSSFSLSSLPQLWSYTPSNMVERHPRILQALHQGQCVSFISDAGTPGISDPGNEIITYLYTHRYPSSLIRSIPGPSSLTTIVSRSGWNIHQHYEGIAQDFAKRMVSYLKGTTNDKDNSTSTKVLPHKLRSPFLAKPKPSPSSNANGGSVTGTPPAQRSSVSLPPASNGILYLGFLPSDNKSLRQELLYDIVKGRYKDLIVCIHEANVRLVDTLKEIQTLLEQEVPASEAVTVLSPDTPHNKVINASSVTDTDSRVASKGRQSKQKNSTTTIPAAMASSSSPVITNVSTSCTKPVIIGRELTKTYEEIVNYGSVKEAIEYLERIITESEKKKGDNRRDAHYSLRGEFTVLLGPTLPSVP